jgi:hypothetical protein
MTTNYCFQCGGELPEDWVSAEIASSTAHAATPRPGQLCRCEPPGGEPPTGDATDGTPSDTANVD